MVFVSQQLVASYLQALAAAQHYVLGAQRRRRQNYKQEQECATSRKTKRGAKGAF